MFNNNLQFETPMMNFSNTGNVYSYPVHESNDFAFSKNFDSTYMMGSANVGQYDGQGYAANGYLNQTMVQGMNTEMSQNMVKNEMNQTMMGLTGHEMMNGGDLNGTFKGANGFENGSYVAPEQYFNSTDQYGNLNQFYKPEQFGGYTMTETTLVEPGITIGDGSPVKQCNSPSYSYTYQPENYANANGVNYDAYSCYTYVPNFQENSPVMNAGNQNVQSNMKWNDVPVVDLNNLAGNSMMREGSEKNSQKDEFESMANASTCESTPVLMPSPAPSNSQFPLNGMVLQGMADQTSMMNFNGMNAYPNVYGDLASTQFVNPGYYQDMYNQTMNGYGYVQENGYLGGEALSDSIIEIANEIANNVQYLPEKDSNGKYSLDKNHPIHCVWRDVNRGHCSWRCRWWENGKRLSKNFNVKRFGEFEAMRMAITMKIRNSTPMERVQLLKEQREAVKNNLQLYNNYPLNYGHYNAFDATNTYDDAKITKVMSDNKKLQRENWNRLSWTYVKTHKMDNSKESTIVCRLCSKTTRCSRSRNLQQAHIMHLIRMHKNPWKKYIDPNGLTKMCKLALDALYQQHKFDDDHTTVPAGVTAPEPAFL